jgi:hypothetical protein
MASKQTRRSISVRGTTYDALRGYCDDKGRSMSDVVEELLAQLLGGEAKAPAKKPSEKMPAPIVARPPREARTLANKVARSPRPEALLPRTPLPVKPLASTRAASSPGRPAPTPATAVAGTRRPMGSFSSF